jgi:hypothetical protein
MTPSEFQGWRDYFIRWPFDDRSRYHRPAALIASLAGSQIGDKGKWVSPVELEDALDWLDRKPAPESMFSAADQAMFKAAGIRPPRKG